MATIFSHPISAKNQISGKVGVINSGSTMTLVTVFAHGHRFVAAMTNEEAMELNVKTHDNVLALIESTQTMLVKGDATHLQISACNRLVGHVSHIRKDYATGSVTVTTESGKSRPRSVGKASKKWRFKTANRSRRSLKRQTSRCKSPDPFDESLKNLPTPNKMISGQNGFPSQKPGCASSVSVSSGVSRVAPQFIP